MPLENKYKRALTIAGFDGSGGAGIQADLKTFSALGCYGMTVLTALPVQNTKGVKSIYEISTSCVEEQLQAILEDIGTDSLKVGMLHREDIVKIVVSMLTHYPSLPIVVDPVLVATSGDQLVLKSAISSIKTVLFPITTLLTPNLYEASKFLEREVRTKNQMKEAAFDLAQMGPKAVLVKGGHLLDSCDDCLCINGKIYWISHERIQTINTHGTGCTLSAAICAFLARGFSLFDAVQCGKKYLYESIKAGAHFKIGEGHGPVHHFHSLWRQQWCH